MYRLLRGAPKKEVSLELFPLSTGTGTRPEVKGLGWDLRSGRDCSPRCSATGHGLNTPWGQRPPPGQPGSRGAPSACLPALGRLPLSPRPCPPRCTRYFGAQPSPPARQPRPRPRGVAEPFLLDKAGPAARGQGLSENKVPAKDPGFGPREKESGSDRSIHG